MASNTKNTRNTHHVRSASYPPDQSNSTVLLKLVDQKINDLQKLEASSTSPMELIRIGFSGLAALYKFQHQHQHQHQPNVESISILHLLLPICCSSRDLVLEFRQGIADLMSSSDADASSIVSSYLSLRKQTARRARELRSSLRHLESSFVSNSYTMINITNINEQIKMRRVLECVSIINISVLDSLLHLLALPLSKPNKSYFKFSLFPKLRVPKMSSIVKPQVVRDEKEKEKEMGNELTNVDIALHSHSVSSSDARQRLKALQVALEGIQDGLHSIASHLSQFTTSLVDTLI